MNNSAAKNRLLLWVDAVGGFYVCSGNEIRVGQAVPGSTIELPLLADLSRHHATIRRDEEGYTIEPIRDVRLNGETIKDVSWINDGSLIEM
ncbi:MAG: FHA domain-containing protein, partial [Planctomycetes bacterium]|nr:FHA domain-containing protein [Planctomycetota bacterium]